jgi:Na+/melibiose symporter-like transporter
VQTEHAQAGILLTASVYAGLAFLASGFSMFFYPINREKNRQIANELSERRKGFAAPTAS